MGISRRNLGALLHGDYGRVRREEKRRRKLSSRSIEPTTPHTTPVVHERREPTFDLTSALKEAEEDWQRYLQLDSEPGSLNLPPEAWRIFIPRVIQEQCGEAQLIIPEERHRSRSKWFVLRQWHEGEMQQWNDDDYRVLGFSRTPPKPSSRHAQLEKLGSMQMMLEVMTHEIAHNRFLLGINNYGDRRYQQLKQMLQQLRRLAALDFSDVMINGNIAHLAAMAKQIGAKQVRQLEVWEQSRLRLYEFSHPDNHFVLPIASLPRES